MKLLIILAAFTGLVFADDATTQLGISCKQPLGDGGMYDFIDKNLSNCAVFHDGQQVACKSCHLTKMEGSCVFLQKMGTKTATGKQVKDAVKRLKEKGCKYCGSAPLFTDNVNDGEVTVNYVTNGCIKHGDKICAGEGGQDHADTGCDGLVTS
ncbi:uncharacterized protein N0V89_006372 [Didymosphaeria variabile]|uniref:Killer toxin Kp4 domain-containing protein n=1 Tax=Didymosphaeria variabile TaxID=1932322 RepID=A0A9W9CC59_9PLEO|nr:uncharacterized protein N0V89_006372 [Didymosphaeria variabile]KAJ4354635.1 hypothetical protein N0V89_006372 [Didymosphaeria variabile]